jgi:hypothetical protein
LRGEEFDKSEDSEERFRKNTIEDFHVSIDKGCQFRRLHQGWPGWKNIYEDRVHDSMKLF